MIQKGASVLHLTYQEDAEKIKKMWEEEEKKKDGQYKVEKKGSKKLGEQGPEE